MREAGWWIDGLIACCKVGLKFPPNYTICSKVVDYLFNKYNQ